MLTRNLFNEFLVSTVKNAFPESEVYEEVMGVSGKLINQITLLHKKTHKGFGVETGGYYLKYSESAEPWRALREAAMDIIALFRKEGIA